MNKNGEQVPGAELKEIEIKDFKNLYETFFETPLQGSKADAYITIAKEVEITKGDPSSSVEYRRNDHYHRYNHTQLSAQFIAYDGDASKSDSESCIPVSEIHTALDRLNYRYILYTTHSHSKTKNRWRVIIPCFIDHIDKHKPTMLRLFQELEAICPDLKWTNESKTWSQPWYVALRDNPEDGLYESYFNNKGRDFLAVNASPSGSPSGSSNRSSQFSSSSAEESATEAEMLNVLLTGGHPLHQTMNNYIYGRIKDGMKPGAVKSHLHAFTQSWDLSDSRLQSRKNDIDRLVDQASTKFSAIEAECSHWTEEISTEKRIFTEYPNLGGRMEEMVQEFMQWCPVPNRQIAVLSVRALIATMGGRVYSLPGGGGIALTALLTGRSTIGKSFIKKYINWVLSAGRLQNYSADYLGAQLYTSAKNFIEDYLSKNSLLSIRTESGQSDGSNSGDMSRVRVYELEASTNSGPAGYISAGGQNKQNGKEVLPALYSPSITTIRESVAKIQNDADVLNQSTVSGIAGRRSVVIVDPIQAYYNTNQLKLPSEKTKRLIDQLNKIASEECRKNPTVPMKPEHWIEIKYEDPEYLISRHRVWTDKNNAAYLADDELTATMYGRLGERIPAFAACLAIVENPLTPVVSTKQFQIAEQCLINEQTALNAANANGDAEGPWTAVERKIKEIFSGDLTRHVKRYPATQQKKALKELKDGCLGMSPLSIIIQHLEAYKLVKSKPGFTREFESRLENLDIHKLSTGECQASYGHRRKTFKRK